MSVAISIPHRPEPCDLQLVCGDILYVLGANGTGKSALMHRLNADHGTVSRWIKAYRQTSLQSGGSNLTTATKEQNEKNLQALATRPEARWFDRSADVRVNMAIFDLIQKLNKQNQQIVDAVRADKNAEAKKLATSNRDPLVALSDLFKVCQLAFHFFFRQECGDRGKQVWIRLI